MRLCAVSPSKQSHTLTESPPAEPCPLPVELLQRILTLCHPRDVISFSKSCRLGYAIVFHPSDQYLWRDLFLSHPFDDPRKSSDDQNTDFQFVDWMHEHIRRMEAEWIAYQKGACVCQKACALKTFISVLHDASPAPGGRSSGNISWLEPILRRSCILYDDNYTSDAQRMLFAQLRSYAALTFDNGVDYDARLRLTERRKNSRCFVYDFRNYANKYWGPFRDDGSVDWIHIEHLINVVLLNIRDLPGSWKYITPPLRLNALRTYSAPSNRRSIRDWAGVEGIWQRYVCFMDFRDLFAFNYSGLSDGPGDPTFFECPRFREGTRLMELNLKLVSENELRHRWYAKGSSANDLYPPLCFSGSTSCVKGSRAVVEGVVQMSADNIVRWQFVSTYPGDLQWRSDGAQVGNVGSAIGVVGVWATELHDEGDPVGPFWLWKVKDDCPTRLMEYV
ncbi:hypothetical protein Hypma_015147 [Hypsizygus marmoreus]|uniref:F-box domain-containing protein n=1 Tax=Hypsizygus marmoreus TaxID=39966 RepID=A0A369K342_HYPMA|nr:hypothetical protein Hypma_015147 [Hypsizygus marmoreus]